MAIDESHGEFHTLDGRYAPFAAVLKNDGYQPIAFKEKWSPKSLASLSVLVVANPLSDQDEDPNRLPTPSAFSADDIALAKTWVAGGGALLIIADHMPFGGAVHDLAAAFGFVFENAFAAKNEKGAPERFTVIDGTLRSSLPLKGRRRNAPIREVLTFTGTAFTAPREAIPLLRLDSSYSILRPDVAWEFKPDTPSRPATENDLRGAILSYGKGRIAVFSEAAMFSAQTLPNGTIFGFNAPGAEQNKQFLLNVMHWLSKHS